MQEEIIEDEDEKLFLASKSLSAEHTLRSEMAQEIISRQPGFLEKWSLLIFLGILVLMFGGTWFVHCPDIVAARAVLTAENNPKEILVRQEGRLIKLLVKNNQSVKQNDIVGWIENSADHKDVIELSKQIDQSIYLLNTNNPKKIFSIGNTNLIHLGEIQENYEQFLIAVETFNSSILNGHNSLNHPRILFQQQLQSLKKLVNEWENRYLLRAPIDGKISFNNTLEENRYLRAGTLFGYVTPNDEKYYAETILSQNNLGKIDTGLHIQLRLDAYPYEEWGFLKGTISYISNVPSENGFSAIIKLDNGLVTNNQKRLLFRNGLRGQAIIITKDMRLLQRFYYGFVKSTSIDK